MIGHSSARVRDALTIIGTRLQCRMIFGNDGIAVDAGAGTAKDSATRPQE
jgi:hypothetical protein